MLKMLDVGIRVWRTSRDGGYVVLMTSVSGSQFQFKVERIINDSNFYALSSHIKSTSNET